MEKTQQILSISIWSNRQHKWWSNAALILPHIKRFSVSHAPKLKLILWRKAAPTAAISRGEVYHLQMFAAVLAFLTVNVSSAQKWTSVSLMALVSSHVWTACWVVMYLALPHQPTLPLITHLAFHPRFRDVLLQTSFHFKHNKHKYRVSHLGFTFHKEVEGNHLTCFLRHGPEPRDEPQQEPREAYLEAEQLLSLSPPGFTPPSVQHHPRSSSCGHGRVWHPIYHCAGHGALVRPSGPAVPPVVLQRF